MHRAAKIEEYHGDLDEHYAKDRMGNLIEALTYYADDGYGQLLSRLSLGLNSLAKIGYLEIRHRNQFGFLGSLSCFP